MASKETPKPKTRSPEYLAAGAAVELAKLDAAILKARETLAQKESDKKAVLDGLDPAVRAMVARMRGETKP